MHGETTTSIIVIITARPPAGVEPTAAGQPGHQFVLRPIRLAGPNGPSHKGNYYDEWLKSPTAVPTPLFVTRQPPGGGQGGFAS